MQLVQSGKRIARELGLEDAAKAEDRGDRQTGKRIFGWNLVKFPDAMVNPETGARVSLSELYLQCG
ncbi:MAG: hypothetical protein ACLU80_05000 [Dorea sp.]